MLKQEIKKVGANRQKREILYLSFNDFALNSLKGGV